MLTNVLDFLLISVQFPSLLWGILKLARIFCWAEDCFVGHIAQSFSDFQNDLHPPSEIALKLSIPLKLLRNMNIYRLFSCCSTNEMLDNQEGVARGKWKSLHFACSHHKYKIIICLRVQRAKIFYTIQHFHIMELVWNYRWSSFINP